MVRRQAFRFLLQRAQPTVRESLVTRRSAAEHVSPNHWGQAPGHPRAARGRFENGAVHGEIANTTGVITMNRMERVLDIPRGTVQLGVDLRERTGPRVSNVDEVVVPEMSLELELMNPFRTHLGSV